MVTHDLAAAVSLGDRILVVGAGRVVAEIDSGCSRQPPTLPG
jgi:ABC-type uncharacterized transport system ATPase component